MATQADLDALKTAYYSGVLEVEQAGKRTRFRDNAQLRQAIGDLERELAGANAAPSHTVGVYSSGLQTPLLDRRPPWRNC